MWLCSRCHISSTQLVRTIEHRGLIRSITNGDWQSCYEKSTTIASSEYLLMLTTSLIPCQNKCKTNNHLASHHEGKRYIKLGTKYVINGESGTDWTVIDEIIWKHREAKSGFPGFYVLFSKDIVHICFQKGMYGM